MRVNTSSEVASFPWLRPMARLDERGAAKCIVDLTMPGVPGADAIVLARVEQEIDIDPRDMWLWDGAPGLPKEALGVKLRVSNSLLASFVRPNHPAVAEIAREAADVRRHLSGDPSFYAFQVPTRTRPQHRSRTRSRPSTTPCGRATSSTPSPLRVGTTERWASEYLTTGRWLRPG